MSAATKLPFYDCSLVGERAAGRWLYIHAYLAHAELEDALQYPKKRHTCPLHGNGRTHSGRIPSAQCSLKHPAIELCPIRGAHHHHPRQTDATEPDMAALVEYAGWGIAHPSK